MCDVARRLQNVALAVPDDEACAGVSEARDAFDLHRPPEDVAADDDLVDALRLDVVEHGLQRRQVAVDVEEGCDAHVADAR